jgi:hypothetical protein
MPNTISPPATDYGRSFGGSQHHHHHTNNMTSATQANPYATMMSLLPNAQHLTPPPASGRPVLHLTGQRNHETSEVTVQCRCVGFPTYIHPIVALFVCRDVHSERDRFTYLGQTQPAPSTQYQDLECVFKISDCPAPPKAPEVDHQKEEDERILAMTHRALVDHLVHGPTSRPTGPQHPVTQLKLNVYQTNTASTAGGGDGSLQMQDLLGTGLVDLERLLEEKQGEDRPVGVTVELRGANLPGVSSPQHSSALSSAITSGSGTPQYTTLRIPHQIPPVGAHSYVSPRHSGNGLTMLGGTTGGGPTLPPTNHSTMVPSTGYSTMMPGTSYSTMVPPHGAASASSSLSPPPVPLATVGPPEPGLYGISQSAVKNVFHTPTILTEEGVELQQKREWERRQKQEEARLKKKGAKPIDSQEVPEGGRYAMGASKSESLLEHQRNHSRTCGGTTEDGGCVVM